MAFLLNGSNQYLVSSAALTPQVGFSVFLRFKIATAFPGANKVIFCAADTVVGAQNYIMLLNGGSQIWVGSYQGSGGVAIIPGLTLTTGVWYSVLGTWGATNQRIAYDGTTRVTDTTSVTTTSTNRTVFGAEMYQGATGSYFPGAISDFAIWSSPLIGPTTDLAQVQGLFSGISARHFRPAVLTDFWSPGLPAGNANGIRGNVLTATNSNALETNPRLYV